MNNKQSKIIITTIIDRTLSTIFKPVCLCVTAKKDNKCLTVVLIGKNDRMHTLFISIHSLLKLISKTGLNITIRQILNTLQPLEVQNVPKQNLQKVYFFINNALFTDTAQ